MDEQNRMFADIEKWNETDHNKGIPYCQITKENAGYKIIVGKDNRRQTFIQ